MKQRGETIKSTQYLNYTMNAEFNYFQYNPISTQAGGSHTCCCHYSI
ncbi:hypothetical protein HDF18_03000 [Mucilaginibacter sp. X5P1]|nr:hypothetical protein [Mucilaginibacter sp. X5P1]MBB6137914.1 hypothetical protein [Mucilaginibacter sp. X5P1]